MLSSGARLSHYEVLSFLGAGGMGQVYRGRDTKLAREVAIKVLPRDFSEDRHRLARFEREGRLLASLNHPNIATLFGLERSGELHFLVMELVLGQTLRERLARGTLPMGEALPLFRQIAEALEAAHEKGIIHRDLKPANVKITPQGRVKVLDFGLAKAFVNEPEASDVSQSPTFSREATQSGVILGTAAYMSPEQARGKSLDRRSDIWSFGCCFYEAVSGRVAFAGDTVTDILARILEREPDWEALPENTPPSLRALLRRCLQKDLERRLHDIADARIEIDDALSGSATPEPDGIPARRGFGGTTLVGLALAAATIAATLVWNLRPEAPQPFVRLAAPLPSSDQLGRPFRPAVAISPEGSHLAYVATRGGSQEIHLRAINQLEARPIPGTEGAENIFFSPDGQWLGFFAADRLKKVSLSGGTPVSLCEVQTLVGASWGPGGEIFLAPSIRSGIWRVPEAGGTPEAVTTLDSSKSELSHRWPEVLPDGRALLFTASTTATSNWEDALIAVQTLETGERRVVIEGGASARYVPTGHLVFARSGTLMAVPFDLGRLEVTGPAVPVVENVMQSIISGALQISFSGTGWLAYVPGGIRGEERDLVWVDRNGKLEPMPVPRGAYLSPRLSPDGRRLAVALAGPNHHLWSYDVARNTLTRLTFEANNNAPVWTPDGKRLTFATNWLADSGLVWRSADGSGAEERLTTTDELIQSPESWSPDGQVLLFAKRDRATGLDIWVLPIGGERKPRPFLKTTFNEAAPVLSPDGRWLAYASDESGRYEIYLQPYPGPGAKWQISTEGGTEPVWARSGRELFYRNGAKMMSVAITTRPDVTIEKPKLLFEGIYESFMGPRANYDVTPDGQRFVMVQASAEESRPNQIHIVFNWFEDLKRRSPRARGN